MSWEYILIFIYFLSGVSFRKYTVKKGKELELKGWCMNTDRGTVLGQLEGEPMKVEQMKLWLKCTGTPKSRIDKAEFRNERSIDSFSLNEFKVRR
ncbi:Acylphosphatase-1 [Zootermopsis nevadensis]|uniref:acylphosphatase n=1 Tax=Zootermopsis nevadensis TaxID=136037 RepID=A0A067QK36_ZOONE|nr:Acylphosphatase-1 [Zootermopsis nevadensis]